jgi:hypothetical protein
MSGGTSHARGTTEGGGREEEESPDLMGTMGVVCNGSGVQWEWCAMGVVYDAELNTEFGDESNQKRRTKGEQNMSSISLRG